MTDIDLDQIRQLRAELAAERDAHTRQLAQNAAARTLAHSPAVTASGLSASELAVQWLVEDSGWTLDQATDEVLKNGPDAYAEAVAWKAQQVTQQRLAQEQADYAASPDGRLAAAEALARDDDTFNRDLEAAHRLLLDAGGFTEDDLDDLAADDPEAVLYASGIWQKPDAPDPNSYAANLAAATAANPRTFTLPEGS